MTFEQFLTEFERIAAREGFRTRPSGDVRSTQKECPIVAVCRDLTGKEFGNRFAITAGATIGLDEGTAVSIIEAADNEKSPLRDSLLLAIEKSQVPA